MASAGATMSATAIAGSFSERAQSSTAVAPPTKPPYHTHPLEAVRKPIGSSTKYFHPVGMMKSRAPIQPPT
jgi:hypothetical protein